MMQTIEQRAKDIKRYGRLLDRMDWHNFKDNFSYQKWEYEGKTYCIMMENGMTCSIQSLGIVEVTA